VWVTVNTAKGIYKCRVLQGLYKCRVYTSAGSIQVQTLLSLVDCDGSILMSSPAEIDVKSHWELLAWCDALAAIIH
jgi:hypothetical protein